MNQWIIGGLLFQCHYFHFYLQWESVFWFVLWFQCLPGLFWKRMELLLRGLKELSDLTGCISIKFVKGRTAFSRRDMWTFFGDGGVHIQTSGNIKGCWSDQEQKGRKIYLLRTKYFCIGGCYVVDHRLEGGVGLWRKWLKNILEFLNNPYKDLPYICQTQ